MKFRNAYVCEIRKIRLTVENQIVKNRKENDRSIRDGTK